MVIKTHELTESLMKKYDTSPVNESITLNEKFSDSMPDWLQKRILTTKMSSNSANYHNNRGRDSELNTWGTDRGTSSGVEDRSKKNPEFGRRPTHVNPRNSNEGSREQNLYTQFRRHGVNLDSVEIIEGPIPENPRSDERLKEPNIPIFLLDNNQVYAVGINDNEECEFHNYKAFKRVPMKTILEHTVAFAYIDGEKDSNFTGKEKVKEREETRKELEKITSQNRKNNPTPNDIRYYDMDKSGYTINPERYKGELNKLKANNIYRTLENLRNKLEDYRKDIISYSNSAGMDYDNMDSLTNLYGRLRNAAGHYNDLVESVDDITSNDSLSDDAKKEKLLDLLNDNWSDYNNLLKDFSNIESAGRDIFTVPLTWI